MDPFVHAIYRAFQLNDTSTKVGAATTRTTEQRKRRHWDKIPTEAAIAEQARGKDQAIDLPGCTEDEFRLVLYGHRCTPEIPDPYTAPCNGVVSPEA